MYKLHPRNYFFIAYHLGIGTSAKQRRTLENTWRHFHTQRNQSLEDNVNEIVARPLWYLQFGKGQGLLLGLRHDCLR